MDIIPRVGTFFLIIGWGLMILFAGSEFSHEANFNYFFSSLLLLFFGSVFRRRAERHESSRFGSLRRARERSRQQREEKYKRDHEKK
jgi:hypothetical protein